MVKTQFLNRNVKSKIEKVKVKFDQLGNEEDFLTKILTGEGPMKLIIFIN
jgi:hypothetical protein